MKKDKIIYVVAMLVFVGIIIFMPIIIETAYECEKKGFYMRWKEEELLVYWGTVLGGIATLLAVYFTIRHGDNIRRQDRMKEKARERYRLVNDLFYKALQDLDGRTVLNFWIHGDSILREKTFLLNVLNNANDAINIHMKLFSGEKIFLGDLLDKFDDYAQEYAKKLLEINECSNEYLLAEKIVNARNGIDESMYKPAKEDLDKIQISFYTMRNSIKKLYDEKYRDLFVLVNENMESFEKYLLEKD